MCDIRINIWPPITTFDRSWKLSVIFYININVSTLFLLTWIIPRKMPIYKQNIHRYRRPRLVYIANTSLSNGGCLLPLCMMLEPNLYWLFISNDNNSFCSIMKQHLKRIQFNYLEQDQNNWLHMCEDAVHWGQNQAFLALDSHDVPVRRPMPEIAANYKIFFLNGQIIQYIIIW